MPDASTPLDETIAAVDVLFKEGKFKRFGVSNYSAHQVDELVQIADAKGYVKPTAYQGIYNALHRTVEKELFPVLRKHGISFYEFNPLGGGASSSLSLPLSRPSRSLPARGSSTDDAVRYRHLHGRAQARRRGREGLAL